MPGFLPAGFGADRVDGPIPLAPIRPHSCADCAKRGTRCPCGRKACKLHAYRCSRCPGVLCEACWSRHEVQGKHEPAPPTTARRGWPHPKRVHRRQGRFSR